ncbi:MAG: prepilin-type N-terminal cleavage/methylation domain-containing protein [Erysipelotrichaceae bacterium]|nr:prepilin-type N-terminal cleavage/methylation domain-containing protein [Erysipelotrichaceae bacterium]
MRTRKAYTLIETMLVILLLPIVLALTYTFLRVLHRYDYGLTERQNFLGILQLRKRIAVGSDIVIKGDSLTMTYNNQNIELLCQNERLIEVEGYMEYLLEIDDCEWKTSDNYLSLSYTFKENTYDIFIGYLK